MGGPTKGVEIRFVGGKYAGKKGWLDMDPEKKGGTKTRVPVIVHLGSRKGEKATFVYRESYEEEGLSRSGTTYADLVIHHCPDIDASMTKLCRDLAKCNIEFDKPGIFNIFAKKLVEAIDLQNSKGTKALYRKIPGASMFEEE